MGLPLFRQFRPKVEEISKFIKGKVSYSLIDQLTRAAISIPLNIAEGNGRWHRREKQQFFRIARGSAFECVPLIHILEKKRLINKEEYREYYERLENLSKMLTKLIQSVETLGA